MAESNKKKGEKKPAEEKPQVQEPVAPAQEVKVEEEVKVEPKETKLVPEKDPRVLVVIPFLAEGAQGRELEYAVAGWRRHFKRPHIIVIVGDYHPIVDTGDDIVFIECPRVDEIPGQYRCHIDHVNKFRKVRERFPDTEGFIYACDDMYAVNNFDMEEVLLPKILEGDMKGDPNSSNAWQRDLAKTRELCVREGLPIRNWICHLPVYYEWDKLFAIYDKYDCDHQSYVVENIYFNTYFADRVPFTLHFDTDNFKCGVYRSNPRLWCIEKAFKDKIWIQNSPAGWIPELDEMLSRYYAESR